MVYPSAAEMAAPRARLTNKANETCQQISCVSVKSVRDLPCNVCTTERRDTQDWPRVSVLRCFGLPGLSWLLALGRVSTPRTGSLTRGKGNMLLHGQSPVLAGQSISTHG